MQSSRLDQVDRAIDVWITAEEVVDKSKSTANPGYFLVAMGRLTVARSSQSLDAYGNLPTRALRQGIDRTALRSRRPPGPACNCPITGNLRMAAFEHFSAHMPADCAADDGGIRRSRRLLVVCCNQVAAGE
ncbi:hypothetical protein FZEAL_1473 [Fusarium zealandicum]|uniref:Uncharacterized protein n=1 Tax=Fusarium zealandicum TaxID=1053134 RepID=A0A8H4UT68_9HYPO|nr:hypothetical protein FZEAL_1473 [Fusarium zealandicum]